MPPLIGVIKEISRKGTEELSVEWQIPNFPSLLDGSYPWYLSPVFGFGDVIWRLSIWPNWNREERMKLDLDRCDEGPPEAFRCSVGIRGSGGVEKRREGEKEFEGYGYYNWDYFCSRSELMEHATRLMPDGTLTVTCVLKRAGADGADFFIDDEDSEEENEDDSSEESEEEKDDKASKRKKNAKQQSPVKNDNKRARRSVSSGNPAELSPRRDGRS